MDLQPNNQISYSILIEGLFAVVIGQNAFLLSKPIVSILAHKIGMLEFIILFFIGSINTLNIIANWTASKKTEAFYNEKLFFWDIITLAIFCVFTGVITESFDKTDLLISIDDIILVFAISYFFIYLTFALWNIEDYRNVKDDLYEKQVISTSIALNVFVMIILFFLGSASLAGLTQINVVMFFIVSTSLLLVLVFYYKKSILSSKRIPKLLTKALWLGGKKRYIKQIIVSILSYLRSPFVVPKKGAIKEYFTTLYEGRITDDLIFDGNDNLYFEKIAPLLQTINLENRTIIDFCCGQGSLYYWLKKKDLKVDRYIGVDFSTENIDLSDDAKIINKDVKLFTVNNPANVVLFIVNGLCYLSHRDFESLFARICDIEDIIIVEPVPGVFWDACFKRIKLYYRSMKKLKKTMRKHGFILRNYSTDYTYKFGEVYFQPLSRAYLFKKS